MSNAFALSGTDQFLASLSFGQSITRTGSLELSEPGHQVRPEKVRVVSTEARLPRLEPGSHRCRAKVFWKVRIRVLPFVNNGGAEGIRTPYLLNAIEALSQLSYSPTCPHSVAERALPEQDRGVRSFSSHSSSHPPARGLYLGG